MDSQGFNLSEFIFSVTQVQPIYISVHVLVYLFLFF